MTRPILASDISAASTKPLADGIMPLARKLGELTRSPWEKEKAPIPVLEPINGPQRPTPGRWPPEVWTEMQAIYAGQAEADDLTPSQRF